MPSLSRNSWSWVGVATGLIMLQWAASRVGASLTEPLSFQPFDVLIFFACLLLAGFIYLLLPRLVSAADHRGWIMLLVLVTGLVLRIIAWSAPPVLANDHSRYLWDGAVTAQGLNPYAYSPIEVVFGQVPDAYVALSSEIPREIADAIVSPHLRTAYPGIAQLAFAASYLVEPWSLEAWRLLAVVAELVAVFLLLVLLPRYGRSRLWVAIYWWNPLVVNELCNSAHVDVLLVMFSLLTLLWLQRGRYVLAAGALCLAVGVKLWPLLALPLLLGRVRGRPLNLAACLLVAMGLLTLLAWPVLDAGMDLTSGFVAYGVFWQMNDGVFMVFNWLVERTADWLTDDYVETGLLSRLLAGVLAIGLVLRYGLEWTHRRADARDLLLVAVVVFMLSPMQFPWYYTWIVVFLPFVPSRALLLLTPLMSFYYLRFYFEATGDVLVYDHWLVWLQYLPVAGLAWWEWRSRQPVENASRERP